MPVYRNNVVDLSGRPQLTKKQLLDELYRAHSAALRSFLRARLGVAGNPDDVVQEVFCKLATIPDAELHQKLPFGADSNRAFIFTVANNLVLNQERHENVKRKYRSEQQAQAEEQGDSLGITPETITASAESLRRVKTAIANLKPTWRRAFVFHRFKGYSYRDIAAEMDVSVKQVEKYIQNALYQVRVRSGYKSELDQGYHSGATKGGLK